MTRLSDMLIYLRKSHGISQEELAKKLGVSRSTIGMYETGKRVPNLEMLEAFADYYNIDMNTLTGGTKNPALENEDGYTEVERAILAGYHAAPNHIQQAVNTLLGIPEQEK